MLVGRSGVLVVNVDCLIAVELLKTVAQSAVLVRFRLCLSDQLTVGVSVHVGIRVSVGPVVAVAPPCPFALLNVGVELGIDVGKKADCCSVLVNSRIVRALAVLISASILAGTIFISPSLNHSMR